MDVPDHRSGLLKARDLVRDDVCRRGEVRQRLGSLRLGERVLAGRVQRLGEGGQLLAGQLGEALHREVGPLRPGEPAGEVLAFALLARRGHQGQRRPREVAQERHEPRQRAGDVLLLAQHRDDDVQHHRLRLPRQARPVDPGQRLADLPQPVRVARGHSGSDPPGGAAPERLPGVHPVPPAAT
ncbi:hypothetical protein UK12_25150 [Saccharothrix sp. ST-888]|nr:hypothetical protein UK12_25150 [Saccharothrix sp. ST-888]